ncbi:MAG: dihydrofolate reductase family protein [Vicinamibacterales bacterium]
MTRVRSHMMMSLDGYVAGANQREARPFGDHTEHFLDWAFKLRSLRQQLGMEGGETGPSDDVLRETGANLGATIMGRGMFGGGPGPWPQTPWNGWWGENPPYHTPVFVLTHHPRPPLAMEGGTTFHFVTDGIESALAQAKAAAGEKDIRIGGGADIANQFLAAGLVDELELHIVPVFIGGGARLFEGFGDSRPALELVRTVTAPDVTHVKYRVRRP